MSILKVINPNKIEHKDIFNLNTLINSNLILKTQKLTTPNNNKKYRFAYYLPLDFYCMG